MWIIMNFTRLWKYLRAEIGHSASHFPDRNINLFP